MKDVRLIDLAARQHNRVAHRQLRALGYSDDAIRHRVECGRITVVERGVYAVAPVLEDERGLWMGATLTAPETFLSFVSGGAAYGFWTLPRAFETVTRPGNGGPRRHGGVRIAYSRTLAGDTTLLGPIPITSPERVLLDLAAHVERRSLARALREAIRLGRTTIEQVVDHLERNRGRRGVARLGRVAAHYSGSRSSAPAAARRSGR